MGNKRKLSKAAFGLSLLTLVLSGYVSLTQQTVWLAGTQWILISILLAVYAIYLDTCTCSLSESQEKEKQQ